MAELEDPATKPSLLGMLGNLLPTSLTQLLAPTPGPQQVPTGVLDPTAPANAYFYAKPLGGDRPKVPLADPPKLETADHLPTGLLDDAREIYAKEPSSSDAPIPTGLLDIEQLERLQAEGGGKETLPLGLLDPEQLAALQAQYSRETPSPASESSSDSEAKVPTGVLDTRDPSEIEGGVTPPTGMLTPEQLEAFEAYNKAHGSAMAASRTVVDEVKDTKAAPPPSFLEGLLKENPPTTGEQLASALGDVGADGYEAALEKLPKEQQVAARALEQEKAATITKLAREAGNESFADSISGTMGLGPKEELKRELKSLPPAMRESVLAKLKGEDGTQSDEHDTASQLLTEVQKEEAADKKYAEGKAKKIEDGIAAAEAAAQANNPHAMSATLDKLSESQRKKVLDKLSPEARAVADKQLELRKERLEKAAKTLAKASDGAGTNEISIIKTLASLTPTEAAELEEIYGEMKDSDGKPRHLRADLQDEFGEDSKERKYISKVLNGDEEAKDLGVELTVKYIESETGAFLDSDESGINDLLRAHADDPEAMQEIADAYKRKTHKDLTEDLKSIMSETELKEATAYQRGDKASANVAVLQQDDPDRKVEVLDENREDGTLAQLAKDAREHDGRKLTEMLQGQLPPGEGDKVTKEIEAAEDKQTKERDARLDKALADLRNNKDDPEAFKKADIKAEALASKLATELGKTNYIGNNTDVTDCLAGLSPAEVRLVMDHYKKQAAAVGKEVDLEADLRKNLKGKDLKVANAVLSGDRVLAAEAFVEQAADGAGTNLEPWRKAMDSLETPEERARFQAVMDKHVGGIEGSAYKDLVKSESSSHDRDDLEARAIVDTDERAAAIAQVATVRLAYGGQYATLIEGMDDAIGDAMGVTDAQRRERRQGRRDHDLLMMGSNLGGSEEAMLDEVQGLQNAKQIEAYNRRMKLHTGMTGKELLDSEIDETTSGHERKAARAFLDGDYEKGQAERMVASKHKILNDNEDGMTNQFGKVRLTPQQEQQLAAITDPKEQAKAREEAMKIARDSLHETVNSTSLRADNMTFDEALKKELDGAEQKVAADRIAKGKASEVNELFLAGDTVIGNLGKDPSKFYSTLGDKSPAEVKAFEAEFFAAHGVDLKTWMLSKATSDGEKRDFKILLEGNYARMTEKELTETVKSDPKLLIQRVKDLNEAARGGAEHRDYDPLGNLKREVGNDAGNFMADHIGDVGERLDARMAKVAELEKKVERGETLSDDDNAALIDNMRYMAGDQKGYTDTKTKAAETVAKVGGKAANAVVTGVTGNTTAGDFAEGMVKVEVLSTVDPARTGTDKVVGMTIETVTNALTSVVAGKYGDSILIQGAGGGLASALGDTRNWNDAGNMLDAAWKGTANATVSALVNKVSGEVGGEGLFGSALSAGADMAATGDLSKSGGELLADFAESAASSYAQNAAKGHHDHKEAARKEAANKQAKPKSADEPKSTAAHGADTTAAPVTDQHPPTSTRPSDAHPDHDQAEHAPKTIQDLQELVPERRPADAATLAAAKAKLASKEPLTPHETRAVLDLAIEATRKGLGGEGVDVAKHADVGGACGPTQQALVDVLSHVLGGQAIVNMHATHPTNKDGFIPPAVPGSALQSLDASHYFTTVHLPDGRVILLDPTFGQFVAPGQAKVGERLVEHGGAAAGAELLKHGYVELTPELADAYGRAITGKDQPFTVDDFATPNRTEGTHGGRLRDRQPLTDAKQAWDSLEGEAPSPAEVRAHEGGDRGGEPPKGPPPTVDVEGMKHDGPEGSKRKEEPSSDPKASLTSRMLDSIGVHLPGAIQALLAGSKATQDKNDLTALIGRVKAPVSITNVLAEAHLKGGLEHVDAKKFGEAAFDAGEDYGAAMLKAKYGDGAATALKAGLGAVRTLPGMTEGVGGVIKHILTGDTKQLVVSAHVIILSLFGTRALGSPDPKQTQRGVEAIKNLVERIGEKLDVATLQDAAKANPEVKPAKAGKDGIIDEEFGIEGEQEELPPDPAPAPAPKTDAQQAARPSYPLEVQVLPPDETEAMARMRRDWAEFERLDAERKAAEAARTKAGDDWAADLKARWFAEFTSPEPTPPANKYRFEEAPRAPSGPSQGAQAPSPQDLEAEREALAEEEESVAERKRRGWL